MESTGSMTYSFSIWRRSSGQVPLQPKESLLLAACNIQRSLLRKRSTFLAANLINIVSSTTSSTSIQLHSHGWNPLSLVRNLVPESLQQAALSTPRFTTLVATMGRTGWMMCTSLTLSRITGRKCRRVTLDRDLAAGTPLISSRASCMYSEATTANSHSMTFGCCILVYKFLRQTYTVTCSICSRRANFLT